jgi:hypothetical protein
MSKDAATGSVTLTAEQFEALLAATRPAPSQSSDLVQLLEAMQRRNPSALDMTGMAPERQLALVSPPAGTRYRDVPGIGAEGSTFLLRVQEVPGFPHGKVVGLAEYKWPKGMLTYQRDGGKVPDDMQIEFSPSGKLALAMTVAAGEEYLPNDAVTEQYRDWRNNTFWGADKVMIGKPLSPHMCDHDPERGGKGLATEWRPAQAPVERGLLPVQVHEAVAR